MTNTDYKRYKRILEDINVRTDYMAHTSAVHYFSIRNVPPWDVEEKQKLPKYMQFAVGELYEWEKTRIERSIIWPLYNVFDGCLYSQFDKYPAQLKTVVKELSSYSNEHRVPMFTYRYTEGMTSPYSEERIKAGFIA